jgi:hypothetical protein
MPTDSATMSTMTTVPSPTGETATCPEWVRLARVSCEELPGAAQEAALDDLGMAPALTPTAPAWPGETPEDYIPF